MAKKKKKPTGYILPDGSGFFTATIGKKRPKRKSAK